MTSCATAPHRFDQEATGRWKARTLIRDLQKKKSHILYAEILAKHPGQLRVDVTTSLGVHLARMTLNEDKLSYLLTRERKYFSGPASPKAMKPILGMPLDPNLLLNILFEKEPEQGEWTCRRDSKEYLESCKSSSESEIVWSDRNQERRTVSIKSRTAQLQLELTGFQPNVEATDSAFELKTPKGFRAIRP